MDVYRLAEERLLIGEVKKVRYRESARMQLAFYLKGAGVHGGSRRGVAFPGRENTEKVALDKETVTELARAEKEILLLIELEKPPPPEKNRFCRRCAYTEFCWS